MNSHVASLRSNAPPVWLKPVVLFVIVMCLLAGVATGSDRYIHLSHLVTEYYHPYLAQAGLSDNFYIWFFLLLEGLMAVAFAIAGGAIALRRSPTWITLFTALALIVFGVTVPPPMHTLIVVQHSLSLPLRIMRATGLALFIIFFYVFPDGKFVFRWTQISTFALVMWSAVWPFYSPWNPYELPHPFPFVVLMCWFSTGVFAQIHRYIRVSSPIQRQQTKWVVFGLTAGVVGDFVTHSPWYIFSLQPGSDWLWQLVHHPFFVFSQLLIPLSIGFSIFRYGLWEIDFIINRTIVYGLLTALLAALWKTSTKLFEEIFRQVLGRDQVPLAAGLSVLVLGLVYGPVYKRLESFIDNYFHPQAADFCKDFIEFLPEAQAMMSLSNLLQLLIGRTMEIMGIIHGAIFLYDANVQLQLSEVRNLTLDRARSLALNYNLTKQLQKGKAIVIPEDKTFPLLVPLILVRANKPELIGVLALGPRSDERGYSHEELAAFKKLAKKVGTAIYIAQLNMQDQTALHKRISIVEDRLEAIEVQISKLVRRFPH